MEYAIGDRVTTPDGPGTVKVIEDLNPFPGARAGVLHDTYPEGKPRVYDDDVLYYTFNEITKGK